MLRTDTDRNRRASGAWFCFCTTRRKAIIDNQLTAAIRLQIVGLEDVLKPLSYDDLDDIYIVNDLMDTDLHQIINSPQPLTDDHVQYFVYA
jgi:hypothetical protein